MSFATTARKIRDLLFDRARSWLGKRSGESVMAGFPGVAGGSQIAPWAGYPLNQVQHYRHWVYRAIDCVSRTVSKEVPRVAFKRTPEEVKAYRLLEKSYHRRGNSVPIAFARRFLSRASRAKAMGGFRGSDSLEDAGSSHPLVRLLNNPNPYDCATTPWYELVMFLELTGTAYLWAVPNKGTGGPLSELWTVPSQWVTPIRDPRSSRLVDYYEVRALGGQSPVGMVRFDPEELIPFQFPSPLGKTFGQSPLQACAELVDVHESILMSRFFAMKNGANVGAVLQLGPDYRPDDDDLARFRAKWLTRAQGEQGFEQPIILPSGCSLDRGGLAEKELAFNASMILVRDEILAMFGVPKNVASIIDGVNRANNIAAHEQFYVNTTNPISRMIMAVASVKIAQRYDDSLILYQEDQRVNDPDQTRADFDLALRYGCCTPNEFRAEVLHLEDFPFGGDDPLVPMGFAPIGMNTGDDLGFDNDTPNLGDDHEHRTDTVESGAN